jgi:hypothetical protein
MPQQLRAMAGHSQYHYRLHHSYTTTAHAASFEPAASSKDRAWVNFLNWNIVGIQISSAKQTEANAQVKVSLLFV